jgi:hypothetical protein
MIACISHEDSFWLGEIKEVNSRVSPLQMPFKEAVLAIWTSKRSFIAVHIQRGFTFARCISQPVDIKIVRVPRLTVILQVAEPTHDSFESRLVSSENLDLIFD